MSGYYLLDQSQDLNVEGQSFQPPWHLAALQGLTVKDCSMARSQMISPLIGLTLAQLSQRFHYPLSYYADNSIIFASVFRPCLQSFLLAEDFLVRN